ncbi:hypothetical protein AB0N05_03325 [Nocardia sp. NPDC051030]|uniref:hypothetical protein n=1 Tax=Nocardia sp. NPDC051030 TaxID=3155162 RepID=UPI003442F1A6
MAQPDRIFAHEPHHRRRPFTMLTQQFFAELPLADAGLREQLAAALTETTDDA